MRLAQHQISNTQFQLYNKYRLNKNLPRGQFLQITWIQLMNVPPKDQHLNEIEKQKQKNPQSIRGWISHMTIYQKIAYIGIVVLAIGICMMFMFQLLLQNYTCQKRCGDQYKYKNSVGQCCIDNTQFVCIDTRQCTNYSEALFNFGLVLTILGILMILFKIPKVSGFFKGIIQKFSIKKPKEQNQQYQRAPN